MIKITQYVLHDYVAAVIVAWWLAEIGVNLLD